jgi:putative transposase
VIVYGDIRDIADTVSLGKRNNQKIGQWDHGKVRVYTEYKAESEGIRLVLQDEAYTSQTCPNCQHRHKPKGRHFRCPACGFQSHRDQIGAVNILSSYKHGEPGKIPVPSSLSIVVPHNLRRARRRCPDTGRTVTSVARDISREAA